MKKQTEKVDEENGDWLCSLCFREKKEVGVICPDCQEQVEKAVIIETLEEVEDKIANLDIDLFNSIIDFRRKILREIMEMKEK